MNLELSKVSLFHNLHNSSTNEVNIFNVKLTAFVGAE